MMLVTMSLLLLMGAAAIAVDLAAMRMDRSADQKVTDSAASAGALTALKGNGQDACIAALEYVAINSKEIESIDTSGCTSIPLSCDPLANPPPSHSVNPGRFDITFVYPVPDGHDLMTSGQLGAPTQAVVSDDGDPCERVGVQMSAEHKSFFAQLIGFDQGTTTVHTVAANTQPEGDDVPLNLLVLDRFTCETITVEGVGSGNGGVIVNAILSEDGTELLQGVAASDSDGTLNDGDPSTGCNVDGVIDLDGNGALLRADGPECDDQTGTGTVGGLTSGHGCGLIQTIAEGTPGCNTPACTSNHASPPQPLPTALPGRLTRQPVDHRYNCWGDYANLPGGVGWATRPLQAPEQDIEGCTGEPDHIYDLINTVGQFGSAGFSQWPTDPDDCIQDPTDPPVTITHDVHINCPGGFVIRNSVTIEGNVIFEGDVEITSSDGSLAVQNALGDPGWAFFRGGSLTRGGSGSLTFNYTMVYMSKDSSFTFAAGGSGTPRLTWIAPDSGPFDDLALWADTRDAFTPSLAGKGLIDLEGMFFVPWTTVEYAGQSEQHQVKAQWVADKLTARGQGFLVLQPQFGRSVEFPVSPRTTIIR